MSKAKVEKKRSVVAVGTLNLEDFSIEVNEENVDLKELLREYNGCFVKISCNQSDEVGD